MEESTKAELARLILTGKKIPARKLYREATDAGLKEAKKAVESLEKEMREEIHNASGWVRGGCPIRDGEFG